MLGRCILSCVAALAVTASAVGQCVFDSMSDGSDGDFSPQVVDIVIDLGLAATGSWNTPGDGNGVYDPDRWVVVFKYMAINIPPNLTVTFINHPSGAPVVWLASEDVVIAGTVKLNGEGEFSPNGPFEYAKGGPGGFDGGAGGLTGFAPSCGFGPGGGDPGIGGSYASGADPYGNVSIIPLIGGSGGGGDQHFLGAAKPGGAGGGAILIASSGTISLLGAPSIEAKGGDISSGQLGGRGSGGGIRLIAQTISGDGTLTAVGGTSGGSPGRIRLEACDLADYTGTTNPFRTTSGPGDVIKFANAPTLRVTMVDGQAVPADPDARVLTKEVVASNDVVTLTIEATNIPVGVQVLVLVTPAHGNCGFALSSPLAGSIGLSTAEAVITLTEFPTEIQLKANWVP